MAVSEIRNRLWSVSLTDRQPKSSWTRYPITELSDVHLGRLRHFESCCSSSWSLFMIQATLICRSWFAYIALCSVSALSLTPLLFPLSESQYHCFWSPHGNSVLCWDSGEDLCTKQVPLVLSKFSSHEISVVHLFPQSAFYTWKQESQFPLLASWKCSYSHYIFLMYFTALHCLMAPLMLLIRNAIRFLVWPPQRP